MRASAAKRCQLYKLRSNGLEHAQFPPNMRVLGSNNWTQIAPWVDTVASNRRGISAPIAAARCRITQGVNREEWLPLVTFALAAVAVSAREATPPPRGGRRPAATVLRRGRHRGRRHQDADSEGDRSRANGQRVEKTLAMAVADSAAPQLETLKPADKVTVLWQRDEAAQRDIVLAITKTPPVSETGKP